MSANTTTVNKDIDKTHDRIGPTDPKLDREMREKLITARVYCTDNPAGNIKDIY